MITLADVADDLFYFLCKVGLNVIHDTTDSVVVLDNTSTEIVFKYFADFFTLTETVEESGQGTCVHGHTGIIYQMGCYTL